ncbi:MAG TPA: alkaline phosphatase [Methylomusa anaerophila]|uniref:Alkaline phosphatase H n=1 Tax=Methylomusa anaerophila TaxID=1930071 RepID=A0A348AGT2_9FIRM|nr:alkaline phosphatase [Methylomusa anaerophila]BBB90280.1 alkaline phosphatase H precursor [Methylomusa anaerophila]HML89375.1 alkaline phosphatase [Methylomusa anaerophila]
MIPQNLFFRLKAKTAKLATALAVIVCLLSSLTVGLAAPAPSPITVLPIDQAKFVVGQTFDFLVEVKDATSADIQVTVNGTAADKYFGKAAAAKLDGSLASYRINQVAFKNPGKLEIAVKAGGTSRTVKYEAVNNVAPKRAKNVILFIGDGMSLPARQMARILSKGITEGKYNDLLEMEKMSNMSLITTSGYDSLVTDSANSASAYATGHKSVVNAMGVYADSTKDPFDDPKVENIVELAKRTKGMATGIVSTANITDATPAAMVAHTRRRAEQNFIAESMLDPAHRPDVILGGGSRHFLPMSTPGSKRTDQKNLVEDFKKLGYSFSGTKSELLATPASASKLLGLYQLDNLNVYIDREMLKTPSVLGGFNDQPNLMNMTQKAIDVLSKNPNGFFLMVEGASIDKQLHVLDWQRATYDTIEMDKAVGIAKTFAKKNGDTLIIIVADHSHGASITGTYHELDGKKGREAVRTYADSVWPTFEDNNKDGFPDDPNPDITLAVQFANHPDFNADYRFKAEPTVPAIMAKDKAVANPQTTGEFQPGNIPASDPSEVHSADDIVLNADGPGAEYFNGVMDNTEVFFAMVRALGLDGKRGLK